MKSPEAYKPGNNVEGVSETIVLFGIVVTEGFKLKSYLFPDTVKQNNKKNNARSKTTTKTTMSVCLGGGG